MNRSLSCPKAVLTKLATSCDITDHEWYPESQYMLTLAGAYKHEDNDCGVMALSVVADIPYELSHKICQRVGRKNKQGLYSLHIIGKHLPFKLKSHTHLVHTHKRKTLAKFVKSHPVGRYYIEIGGKKNCHALALINGIIVDSNWTAPESRIQGCWSINGLKKSV